MTELLSEVSNWHKDEKSYLDGARGTGSQPLHGFRKSWDVNNTEILSYEEFKKAFSKWRVKLLNVSILRLFILNCVDIEILLIGIHIMC